MKHFQAGRLVQQAHYKSFQPNPIHRAWVMDDMALLQLLGQADRELGRLDMYSEYIPNIDLFIRMHVLKEATQSSRIEGTQTNIEEALLEKEDVALERRDELARRQEVRRHDGDTVAGAADGADQERREPGELAIGAVGHCAAQCRALRRRR